MQLKLDLGDTERAEILKELLNDEIESSNMYLDDDGWHDGKPLTQEQQIIWLGTQVKMYRFRDRIDYAVYQNTKNKGMSMVLSEDDLKMLLCLEDQVETEVGGAIDENAMGNSNDPKVLKDGIQSYRRLLIMYELLAEIRQLWIDHLEAQTKKIPKDYLTRCAEPSEQ